MVTVGNTSPLTRPLCNCCVKVQSTLVSVLKVVHVPLDRELNVPSGDYLA